MLQLPISLSAIRSVLAVIVLSIAGWALYAGKIDWKAFSAIVALLFVPSPISVDNNRAGSTTTQTETIIKEKKS